MSSRAKGRRGLSARSRGISPSLLESRHAHATRTIGSRRTDRGRRAGRPLLRAAPGKSHQAAQCQRRPLGFARGKQAGTFRGKYLRAGKGPRDRRAPAFRRDHEPLGAGGARAGLREDRAAGHAGDRFRRAHLHAKVVLSHPDHTAALQQRGELRHLAQQAGEVDGRAGGIRA